jgi:formimidoylglutamate deiminase
MNNLVQSGLTIHCEQVLTGAGWMENQLIEVGLDGNIQQLNKGIASTADISLKGPVIPGMPNLHSHGFQRMIGGLGELGVQAGVDFWGWREAMYHLANGITSDQVGDCMAWVFAEMLSAGFTSCAEFHYLHHQPGGKPHAQIEENSLQVIHAADRAGMAVTLLPVFYNTSGFGETGVLQEQSRFRTSPDQYLELFESCKAAISGQDLHRLGFAPHSLRAAPQEHLEYLLNSLSGESGPIHIHIAEQRAEVEDCLEFTGARPVEWLMNHADVGSQWCLVHATHMNDAEGQAAAQSGAVAGLCPSTEADLGDGFFEADRWCRDEGRFGIGSDSNLRVSVSEELRLLEYSERLRQQKRNVLRDENRSCGRFLYEEAARAGAQAVGQNVGVIEAGRRADLVELDGLHPQLDARSGDAILDSLIFAGGNEMVKSVFVAGRQVISEGQHHNEPELRSAFIRVMRSLLTS